MSERILIGLEGDVASQDAIRQLLDLGASQVEPVEGIPGVLVAHVAEKSADEFIRKALVLPGIRHAERDQLRSTY